MGRSFAKIFVLTTEISALASSQRRHFFNTLEGKQNFMNKIKITSFNEDNSAESYQPYLRFEQNEIRAYQNVKVIAK